MEWSTISRSAAETRRIGQVIGERLAAGDVVCLRGPMGAGKTTLAQGIAAGLGIDEPVSSPTFALVHQYAGRLPLWHVDAYRLRHPDEALDLALPELKQSGVIVIEWPERIGPAVPADHLDVELSSLRDDDRQVTIRGGGARSTALAHALGERIPRQNSPAPSAAISL